MHTGIRPGWPRLRVWWTLGCAIGVALFMIRTYGPPRAGSVTDELMLRLWAESSLHWTRVHREAGTVARFYWGAATDDETVQLLLAQYAKAEGPLSIRGQVEYGILLGEVGRTGEARVIFTGLADSTRPVAELTDDGLARLTNTSPAAAYLTIAALVLPYYGVARLCPSWRFVWRAHGFHLPTDREWERVIGMTALLWVAAAVVGIVFTWWGKLAPSGFSISDSVRPEIVLSSSWVSLILVLLVSTILAPVGEEILWRGLVYPALRARFGVCVGAILSAGLFTLVHQYSWLGAASVFVTGVLWAYAFERTRSLLPSVIVHCVGNLFWVVNSLYAYNPMW